jgi:stage IV sporulation protein B
MEHKGKYMKKIGIIFICLIVTIAAAGTILQSEQWPFEGKNEAAISVVPENVLIPGGHSIGVRMEVKGVLIVGLEEIETIDGRRVNPGLASGLQIGDTILEINGTKVYRASEVQEIINEIGASVRLKVQRKEDILEMFISPVIAGSDNLYKLGVWVKDKTAGIGTLTYYDPSDNTFGALGHAILDPETSSLLSVAEGELLRAEVQSVKEGRAGNPGEIRGIFYEADDPLGDLTKNSRFGIFGTLYNEMENPIYNRPLPVGTKDQVVRGPAYILTTLDGNNMERYQIEIERINRQSEPDGKSMVIKVTDPRLLDKSGGIVQGMSGSPVIQDGRLVGAVTHVMVGDPLRGYGIFASRMIETALEGQQKAA